MVIRRDRIVAAGVQLPLPEGGVPVPSQLGSRHRAALGLSQESDAVVVIVSEETGLVRIAERGELSTPIPPAEVTAELERRLRDDGGLVRVPARAGVAGAAGGSR